MNEPATSTLARLGELVRAKKSGTLVLTTPRGPAEVRLAEGEILDAVYLRSDGERALLRILSIQVLGASFVETREPGLRRIRVDTTELLGGAPEALEALRAARAAVAHLEGRPLVAMTSSEAPGISPQRPSALARALLHELRHPVTLEDLLDVAPGRDTDILAAVFELEEAGRIRALPSTAERVPLGTSEQLGRLRARILEAQRAAVPRRPRLVLAGAAHRLAVIAHCCSCFDGAEAPGEAPPSVPMPYVVTKLPLGEGFEIEIVVCPLVPAYAPLWPQAVAGSLAIVRLDEAAGRLLDEACQASDARVLDAAMLVGPYDEAEVTEVATLVRAAIEA